MEYYDDYDDFSLRGKLSNKGTGRNNKKDNLTEFYNLIYEYKHDCLTASLVYNKEYYSNKLLTKILKNQST